MSASLASKIPQTISEAITQDHLKIKGFYQKFVNSINEDDKLTLTNEFRWDLARHAAGEELVLYPAYVKWLGEEGKRIGEQDRLQHESIKLLLIKLDELSLVDPQFIITLELLVAELTTHFEEEERDDLPKLEAVISREESLLLAKAFERSKQLAPIGARPKASPFGQVQELLSTPIEKLRELFESFPDESASQV